MADPIKTLNNVKLKVTFTKATIMENITSGENISSILGKQAKWYEELTKDGTQTQHGLLSTADKKKLDGIAEGANKYVLPTAGKDALGGVKTTSTVSSATGYTASPIINGVVYYHDTTYTAGTGISIGTDKKVTNTGVRSIAEGTTNGTISVNTNGTAANVAVKGLGSAAYTDSSAYAAAGHVHSEIQANTIKGVLSLDNIPKGALDRLVVVADETARFKLTTNDVQLGDTVKQEDTGRMYYVVDETKLNSAAGYEEYTAGSATSVPWSGVTNVDDFIKNPNSLTITLNGAAGTVYNSKAAKTLDITPAKIKAADLTAFKGVSLSETGKTLTFTRASGTDPVTVDIAYGAEKGITLANNKFGHSNAAVTAVNTVGLLKVKYDTYGHITGSAAITKADITGLGIPEADTHHTSSTIVGTSATAKANANSTNTNTFLNHIENNTVRSSHQIKGTGSTTVTSANGVITINSTKYTKATTTADGLMSKEDKAKVDIALTQPTVKTALESQTTASNVVSGSTLSNTVYNLPTSTITASTTGINIKYPATSYDNDKIKVTFTSAKAGINVNIQDSTGATLFTVVTDSGTNYYRIIGEFEKGLNKWIYSYDYVDEDGDTVITLS